MYYIQFRTGKSSWQISSFSSSFETADAAWRYLAFLDQDGCIPPDARVVDSATHVVARPNAFAFQ